jgi:hypothetical protein
MATLSRSQIPLKFEFLGPDGKVTQPWAFFFQTLFSALPPATGGSNFVVDGTAANGITTIYQGAASMRGANPTANSIYFADDTGQIFTVQGGQWQEQLPAFSGDVVKAAFSQTLTLALVNSAPGTYGSGGMVPVITVDAKGRITNTTLAPIELAPIVGDDGALLVLNPDGQPMASGMFRVDPTTSIMNVDTSIAFLNPVPTFNNLSPATVKGDIITNDGTNGVALPVGTNGQILSADSTSVTGLKWIDASGTSPGFVEFPFNFGDASPRLVTTVLANKMVLSCSIRIITAFDGVGASLKVGSVAVSDDIMATDDSFPGVLSSWEANPNTIYGVDTNVYLTINIGAGGSAGSGLLILTLQH